MMMMITSLLQLFEVQGNYKIMFPFITFAVNKLPFNGPFCNTEAQLNVHPK